MVLKQFQDWRLIGGTGISGVSFGLIACQRVAFSYACANARIRPSEKRGPAIINPIGKPLAENPQGMETAGIPNVLNWGQFERTSGSRGLGSSSRFSSSLMVGGTTRMVGRTTASKSAKASSMVLRRRMSSQFASMVL